MTRRLYNRPFIFPSTSDIAKIGQPAYAALGTRAAYAAQYLKYLGMQQLMSYTGQGWNYNQAVTFSSHKRCNVDYDYDYQVPKYPIIYHTPSKYDTTNPKRMLGGAFIPWAAVPYFDDAYGAVTLPAKITWEANYGSVTGEQTIWESYANIPARWDGIDNRAPQDGMKDSKIWNPIDLYKWNSYPIGIDGNCEASHLHAFVAGNGATLTKDTSAYHTGSQSLKVAYSGTSDPYAKFPIIPGTPDTGALTLGARYRVQCFAAGDGTANPVIKNADGTTLATGTSSTTFQGLGDYFISNGDHIRLMADTSGAGYCNFDDIVITEVGNFGYTPDGDGEFGVGFLRTYRIMVAALSVWTMPDEILTEDQEYIHMKDFRAGKAIRGYTGSGTPSFGDIGMELGYGDDIASGNYDLDDIERNTRRCFFQHVHPLGVYGDNSDDYYNVQGNIDKDSTAQSWLPVVPRNLSGGTADVPSHPAAYVEVYGASGGDPAYLRYEAETSGDTWTATITSNGEQLVTDSSDVLELDPAGDRVRILYKAPSSGSVTCKNLALFEGEYAS